MRWSSPSFNYASGRVPGVAASGMKGFVCLVCLVRCDWQQTGLLKSLLWRVVVLFTNVSYISISALLCCILLPISSWAHVRQ